VNPFVWTVVTVICTVGFIASLWQPMRLLTAIQRPNKKYLLLSILVLVLTSTGLGFASVRTSPHFTFLVMLFTVIVLLGLLALLMGIFSIFSKDLRKDV